jgi:hypothetical protein
VLDGLGAIKVRQVSEGMEALSFSEETIEPISRLGKAKFLDKHGEMIAEALKCGPLRLSDAINRGWFMVDDNMMLGDLVGVFVAPGAIPIDADIMIGVTPELMTAPVGEGELLFTDLEISAVGGKLE